MRTIGSLTDETHARVFSDFLTAQRIANEIEHDAGGWLIWVRDEDQLPVAREHLVRFQQNPNRAEFQQAGTAAEQVRQSQAEELAEYQRRVRTGRSLFPKWGGYGVGVFTYLLIAVCLVMAFYTRMGDEIEVVRKFIINDPDAGPGFLAQVRAGEVWRLFTPMFLHFGPLHLIFNLMWIFHLGSMIEARQSSGFLVLFVAVSGLLSNLAQYYFVHPVFGGMSGVVYALAGYAWIRGKFNPGAGIFLDQQSAIIILVWLVICFAGVVGPIANVAHVSGLVIGMAWGWLAAYQAMRRPE